jgi:hypothetical protein
MLLYFLSKKSQKTPKNNTRNVLKTPSPSNLDHKTKHELASKRQQERGNLATRKTNRRSRPTRFRGELDPLLFFGVLKWFLVVVVGWNESDCVV